MKKVNGFYLPDGEEHLVQFLEGGPEFAGGPTYQLKKLLWCMPHIRNFRRAVDIGAHCGLWTRPLAQMFRWVDAFEPTPAHVECFEENLHGRIFPDKSPPGAVVLHTTALGDFSGECTLTTEPTSSGDTHVAADGPIKATMKRLDDYDLTDVDFIKVDCEGYERHILAGGEGTIRRQKPFIIVEQKPRKGSQFGIGDHAALKLLESWGAVRQFEISGDFGYGWRS